MNEIKNIAFILDGNRSPAKKMQVNPWSVYKCQAKKIEEILNWCREIGDRHVTLYALSLQYFNRPEKETEFSMKLLKKQFLAFTDPKHTVHKYKIRIKAFGRVQTLPKSVQKAIALAEKSTENYSEYFLNIAVYYDGKEEIKDAISKILEKVAKGMLKPEEIDENIIGSNLYANSMPNPDIVIRTGGDHRLSNFLLWQSSYSELYFIEKNMTEFTKEDFILIVKEYQKRRRSFGR